MGGGALPDARIPAPFPRIPPRFKTKTGQTEMSRPLNLSLPPSGRVVRQADDNPITGH